MSNDSLASGQYFWKVQYTVRNEEFQLQAHAVAEMERAFGRSYGFDDPWDEANLHKPEFEQFAADCRKSGCWEVATAIYDKFHVTCTPPPDALDVLKLIESGGECGLHYLPPFYERTFVIDDTTCLSKKEGRNTLTISIDVDSPMAAVNGDISALVRVAKEAVASSTPFKDSFNENWSQFRKSSPINKVARSEGQYSGGDVSRAAGLWVWDYVNNSKNPQGRGVIEEAIEALQDQYDYGEKVNLSGKGKEDLRKLYNKAKKCIDKAVVLSVK